MAIDQEWFFFSFFPFISVYSQRLWMVEIIPSSRRPHKRNPRAIGLMWPLEYVKRHLSDLASQTLPLGPVAAVLPLPRQMLCTLMYPSLEVSHHSLSCHAGKRGHEFFSNQLCYQEMGESSVSKGGLVVIWLCDQPDPWLFVHSCHSPWLHTEMKK